MDSPGYERSSRSHSPVDSRRRAGSRSRSVERPSRRRRSRSGSENGYDYRRRSRSRSPVSRGGRRGSVERENPKPSHCIGIFGLSIYTTEKQLDEIFDEYGEIQKTQVILDAQTGKSRGFAFIYYDTVKAATRAKEDCNGIEIDGRRIRVDYSITSRAHTPTPGIYMGKPTYSSRSSRGYGGRSSFRDRYRSPSPNYRSGGGGRRDYGSRGYDRDDYGRYDDRRGGSDRYGGSSSRYDRYDRPSRNDRYDRSRSNSPRRYRY